MTTTSDDHDRLYELVPALYRILDEERAGDSPPLRALLGLINAHADALRDDVGQLWDDFFIETCQRWVVPYLGDLVGNVPLHDLDNSTAAQTAESLFTDLRGPSLAPANAIRVRADVANTIGYRRRKGTVSMLEQLARDVTGWDARVVEFFNLLTWNQHLDHVRTNSHSCPDLRSVDLCGRVDGPWDTDTHTVDVRAISADEGWYNISNIGFFLWRLNARPHNHVTPRAVDAANWRLTFSPIGADTHLFCRGRTVAMGQRGTEPDINAPIRPAAFATDLQSASSHYYGIAEDSSITVFRDGAAVPVDQVRCANLGDWNSVPQPPAGPILIDVARGRLAIPAAPATKTVEVSYCDGFAGDLGGGDYARERWLSDQPATTVITGGGDKLQQALAAANPPGVQVIQINDNLTYPVTGPLAVGADNSVTIQAGDQCRPHILVPSGELTVSGGAGTVTLNGLLLEGGVSVVAPLRALRVLQCTLVPDRAVHPVPPARASGPSIVVPAGAHAGMQVHIAFSVVGALQILSSIDRLWILDSLIDGADADDPARRTAISGAGGGPRAHLERVTVLGTANFSEVDMISDSLFTGAVTIARRQSGCLRFSSFPDGSATPMRYRCQPDLASAAGRPAPQPVFGSTHYGDPDYGQFRGDCPTELSAGAENGSEMGAFCFLQQPHRAANLRLRLNEYLPVGLDVGLIYVDYNHRTQE